MTQAAALAILKTGVNVFLTGEPGSGKTYTIQTYVSYLRAHGVEPAITASTGIAATHIHGSTIHSWSGIGIKRGLSPYDIDRIATTQHVYARIRKARVLIIDEVSMLDAETLDAVDAVCRAVMGREEVFGGIQVVLVGDFFQLPPIAKGELRPHFAFESHSWQEMRPIVCYISEQHRQKDDSLLDILSAIRAGEYDEYHHEQVSSRRTSPEVAKEKESTITRLFAHNADVDTLNDLELQKLAGVPSHYSMTSKGKDTLVESLKKGCLSPEVLVLKQGAIVMCTKNSKDKGYVNGTVGIVVGFEKGTHYPIIETTRGTRIIIEPAEWRIEDAGKVKASISQIPLRLAWAITIHKSQGISLDEAVIDLSEVFEYGQGYVALSRVRTLGGLHLLGWNERTFQVHPHIKERDSEFKRASRTAGVLFGDMPSEKLTQMQHNFLRVSGGFVEEKSTSAKKRGAGDTLENTKLLVLRELSLAQIAKERGLTVGTILTHIEKLVAQKALEPEDIEYLLQEKTIQALPGIAATFQNYDTTKIAQIYDHYKGRFSYEQLRLARLMN